MALGKDYGGGGGHAARARRVHVLRSARSPNTRATRDARGRPGAYFSCIAWSYINYGLSR